MSENKKFIRRVAHDKENPYVMVRRATVQNKKLTYEASGMLSYLLSQRDDWRVQPNELVREGCGRDKVYRILKELIQKYYIEHEKSFDTQHKIVWGDYIVHEYPVTENPDTENQDMDLREKPYPENPDMEKPDSNKYGDTNNESNRAPAPVTSKTKQEAPSTADCTALIEAWVQSAGLVDMGQKFTTTSRLKHAKAMLNWTIPVTCEEIREYTKYLVATKQKVNFEFIQGNLGMWRSENAKKFKPPVDPNKPMTEAEYILSQLQEDGGMYGRAS